VRNLEGRGVFPGIGYDDHDLTGPQAVLAVVALGEGCAVTDQILDEAGGGIGDGADADEAAGAPDDLAGDDVAVAGAESVDHAATRDAGAEHRREPRDSGGVALAGEGEHLERLRVIGVGERGHAAGNEAARGRGKAGTWRCASAAQQPTVYHGATEAQRTERFRASEIREPGEERLTL